MKTQLRPPPTLRNFLRRPKRVLAAAFATITLCAITLLAYFSMHTHINDAAYQPLLATIAKGESNSNYNAHFGNAANTTVRFTDMTIAQVMQWQTDFVALGKPSSAVGKYQIIRSTLAGLVRELRLDATATRFSEATQDRLAIALINRRGAYAFVQGTISREQFAANLSQEWAALPRVLGANPQQSYYAGDGLNAAQLSVQEILSAVDTLKARA